MRTIFNPISLCVQKVGPDQNCGTVTMDSGFDSDEYFTGLNYESGGSSEEESHVEKPKSQYRRRKDAKERRRKDAEWDAFAGTYFDDVDFSEDDDMPTVTVREIVQNLDHEYPKCPDIDAASSKARLQLSLTWLKLGHRKSVHERMKKELHDRAWTCPTCHRTMRISDCRCGQPADKHFAVKPIPCAGFDPALQSEHGSLVCVECMLSTDGWDSITEFKQLLHSVPEWLIFLRHLLANVKKKSVLHANLRNWQQDITKYGRQYSPALQTLLETDAMAIGSRDVFFPTKPENQTRLYQRYKLDGKFNAGNWADVWIPALNILDTVQDWKPSYKALCAISGQLAMVTALWVKATVEYTPDPGRRQTLKKGETLTPTDPWTAGYLRYASPHNVWMPALDRLICFWLPLTVRGPGKCLPSLTIGVNELLYNLVKGHVTEQQHQARAAKLAGKSSSAPSRAYQLKRGKEDRGRDYASGAGVRVDTPGMEDFATMYTAAAKMITDHHQVPMVGVGATGAYQFVNYVLSTCNRSRARYASKYRPNEKETPIISTCYSNFIAFLGILKLYGVPLNPPVFPSRADMDAGNIKWRIPPLVREVVQDVPALASKLSAAVRYIYTGVPLRRIQKIGDLITSEMRQAMKKLDETGSACPVPTEEGGVDTTMVQCALYAKKLEYELGHQAIGLTHRKKTVDLKLATAIQSATQHQLAIKTTRAAFLERIARLHENHEALLQDMTSHVGELESQQRQLTIFSTIIHHQLAQTSQCQADIGEVLEQGLDLEALKQVACRYNTSALKLPTLHRDRTQGEPSTVTVSKDRLEALEFLVSGLRKQVE